MKGSGNTSLKVLLILVFTMVFHCKSFGQSLSCPELSVPSDGATEVDVNTGLEWTAVLGATGYAIRIGT